MPLDGDEHISYNYLESDFNHSSINTSSHMPEQEFSRVPSIDEISATFQQFCSQDFNDNVPPMQPLSQLRMKSETINFLGTGNHQACSSSSVEICVICGDKASGKHYGAVSCEGCKGFFKRSVRRNLRYACKNDNNCPIDLRKRTRCQHCRLSRCILKGMRIEAVQEERHTPGQGKPHHESRGRRRPEVENYDLTISSLVNAELLFEMPTNGEDEGPDMVYVNLTSPTSSTLPHPIVILAKSVEAQLSRLVDATSSIPAFSHQLSKCDQLALLKSAWPELLLISLAYRSMPVFGGLLFASRHHLSLEVAVEYGLGPLTARLNHEIVRKFRDLAFDRTELAILKSILLFNPDAPDLSVEGKTQIDRWRDDLYVGLQSYCTATRNAFGGGSARASKLLLRLAPLRSISMKCLEYIVFTRFANEDPTSQRLLDLIERGIWPTSTDSN